MPRIISNQSEYIRDLQEIADPIEADILTNAGNISTVTTTANAALPKTGGILTGNVTTNSTITSTGTSGVIAKKYIADLGLLATPSYAFSGYPTIGIFHDPILAGERLVLVAGGNRRIFMSKDGGIAFTTGVDGGSTVFTMLADATTTFKNFLPGSDNALTLGGSGARWDSIWARTATISTSDARYKRDILNLELGLSFITKLNPVSYIWIDDEVFDEETQMTKTVTHSRRHLGLIAQDVHTAINECGEDLNSTDILSNEHLINPDAKDQYGVRYEMFIPCLINSIKELSAEVSTLKTRIELLESG
jgi:hypothetical protein